MMCNRLSIREGLRAMTKGFGDLYVKDVKEISGGSIHFGLFWQLETDDHP
jgi:hypothetical protein